MYLKNQVFFILLCSKSIKESSDTSQFMSNLKSSENTKFKVQLKLHLLFATKLHSMTIKIESYFQFYIIVCCLL